MWYGLLYMLTRVGIKTYLCYIFMAWYIACSDLLGITLVCLRSDMIDELHTVRGGLSKFHPVSDLVKATPAVSIGKLIIP